MKKRARKTKKSRAGPGRETLELKRALSEAHEQQAVTSEILRIISRSPADTQPVFDAIVKSGVHLFDGLNMSLRLVKGDQTEIVATTDQTRDGFNLPTPLNDDRRPSARAILRREVVQIPDILAEGVSEVTRVRAARSGTRAILYAPMLRENDAIGVVSVSRATAGPFTDKQIVLLQTFANQAVIAIENVRLFKELQARNTDITEALERQTATADILRVISSSPTDIQPVLDAVASTAARLCGASDALIRRVDGDVLRLVAHYGAIPAATEMRALNRDSVMGKAVLDRQTIQVLDAAAAGATEIPITGDLARLHGFRTVLSTPLLREGQPIGALAIRRVEVRPFSGSEIKLLETFADQAVIAIENVRLFKELQARNAEVTEALEQQTATSEILSVISSSPTDLQPVFDAILENATRLCGANLAALGLFDGERYQYVAQRGGEPGFIKRAFPEPFAPVPGTNLWRTISGKRPVHVHDLASDRAVTGSPGIFRGSGARTLLSVPMLKEGQVIGTIITYRSEVRPFGREQIDLLTTFANQATIAIQNVRLFKELQARNAEVTEALEQQTATADILKVISGSPTDTQPVFDAIVKSCAHLFGSTNSSLRLIKGDRAELVAKTSPLPEAASEFPYLLEDETLPASRAILRREVVQIPDALAETWVSERFKQRAKQRGFRSIMVAPMLREISVIGTINVSRAAPGTFTDKQVALLRTFADQAVIAIENVRLFNEIQDKSRQLETANKHKSDFLAHMSHELRTPLNAIIGFSEALIARMFGEVNAKQDEYLQDIHSSGHHLLSLINDILDLSKVEAGRMELELSEFHLPSALKNALTLVRERAQTHGIALGLTIDPKLDEIRADERKVKQIVLNLLSNAVKFTPDGGRVDVGARVNGGSVEIFVKDTGAGIAPDDQEMLFAEFSQVGRDYARKQEGTGLGLALTRRFVELHGGKIRVESAPGEGSTFAFTLPLSNP